MAFTTESPPTRWPRLIPRQFSLRVLLVLITVAGLVTWWFVRAPQGMITEDQLKLISNGQSQDEVRKLLGKPAVVMYLTANPANEIWMYRVGTSTKEEGSFNVIFPPGSKSVSTTTRSKNVAIGPTN